MTGARGSPRRSDAGSATVWVLTLSVALLSLCWVLMIVVAAVGARHRAEAAADLAALSGAAAVESGADGCQAAETIAVANHARTGFCAVAADGSLTVTVELAVPPMLTRWVPGAAVATARAGP